MHEVPFIHQSEEGALSDFYSLSRGNVGPSLCAALCADRRMETVVGRSRRAVIMSTSCFVLDLGLALWELLGSDFRCEFPRWRCSSLEQTVLGRLVRVVDLVTRDMISLSSDWLTRRKAGARGMWMQRSGRYSRMRSSRREGGLIWSSRILVASSMTFT